MTLCIATLALVLAFLATCWIAGGAVRREIPDEAPLTGRRRLDGHRVHGNR